MAKCRPIYRGGRLHRTDMSVVVPITLSGRPRVLPGFKVTWNTSTTDIGDGTDTDFIGACMPGLTVRGCTVRSPRIGCQVTSRSHDRFSRYSMWLDTFRTALVFVFICRQQMTAFVFIHHSHMHKKTHRTDKKKLTKLIGKLCCSREHSVQFFVQFFLNS